MLPAVKTWRRLRRPIRSARTLIAPRRSQGSDLILGTLLAAIAGATNAGGFFALGQYTSHMTGYLSLIADNLVILRWQLVAVSALAVVSFAIGAAVCTILIHRARSGTARHQYAWPLGVQGGLLGLFAMGGMVEGPAWRLGALALLCFIMGMQNATITKISGARIRTTHATGMVTDVGIAFGRAIYGRVRPDSGIRHDPAQLSALLQLIGAFVIGGIAGATGYGVVGFLFSIPLALVLLALGLSGLGRRAANR